MENNSAASSKYIALIKSFNQFLKNSDEQNKFIFCADMGTSFTATHSYLNCCNEPNYLLLLDMHQWVGVYPVPLEQHLKPRKEYNLFNRGWRITYGYTRTYASSLLQFKY